MSAFVVSKNYIDALVKAALGYRDLRWFTSDPEEVERGEDYSSYITAIRAISRTATLDRADEIGDMLVTECVRSVAHRYPDDNVAAGELPGPCDPYYLKPYRFNFSARSFLPIQILSALDTYEYQACEHPEWRESEARSFCDALRRAMIRQIPGYDDRCIDEPTPTPTPQPVAAPEPPQERLDRAETIKRIRAGLKRRSGKSWSVTGGSGTAWGWITIQAPPKRRTGKHVQREGAAFGEYEHVDTGEAQEFGLMTPADCTELGKLLGLDKSVHPQGESVPSGSDYYREYVDRAEGREPTAFGKQYWD